MNRFLNLAAVCLCVAACASAADPVPVSDTLHLGVNGALAAGTIQISNPQFQQNDGTAVAASSVTVPVASNGVFSTSLYSTDSATLTNGSGPVFYSVKYYLQTGQAVSEKWYIPTPGVGTTVPLTIQEILKPNPLNLPVLASLPSTCTAGATGFYNGNSYVCTATNVWSIIPLDYQHLPGTPNALTQSQLGAANGVAALDSNAQLQSSEIPAIPYGKLTGAPDLSVYALQSALGTASTHAASDFLSSAGAGVANGTATLDANGKLTQAQIPSINVSSITGLGTAATHSATDFLFANILGQPSGAAQLDSTGKLVTGELPALTTSEISDFPANLPPSGGASGDLGGNYPSPTVKAINGTNLANLGTGLLKMTAGIPSLATSQDVTSAFGYTPADVAKNGSDFTNPATFRTNIGLGTVATHSVTDFLADTGTNGLVKRTGAGATGVAGPSDVEGALGFTPANAALLGAHSGIATLDTNGQVPISQIPNIPFTQVTGVPDYVLQSAVGANNGIATLDSNGKVPTAQIPAQPLASSNSQGEILVGNTLQISTGGNGNPAAGTLDVKSGIYDAYGAATTAQNNSLQKAANLSDVADAAMARNNLGIQSAATHPASDFILASSEGVANGVATLDASIKVPVAQIPNIPLGNIPGLGTIATHAEGDYLASAMRGAANGVASLDGNSLVPVAQIPNIPATQITGLGTAATHPASDFVATIAVNAASGVAGLDSTTKVPVAEIPALPYSILSNPPTISAVGHSGAYADLIGAPTALPPNGPASGDLGGSFPSPTVTGLNGTKLSTLGAGLLKINSSGVPSLAGTSDATALLGFTPMNPANNLSELADKAAARAVLGIGTAGTHAATDFLADSGTNGLVMRTGAGTTAAATSADIITGLGFTPLGPSSIGAASGVAGLDSGGKVPIGEIPNIPFTQVTGVPSYILSSLIGAQNGVAPLDSTGKVPNADLPTQPLATGTTAGQVIIGSGFIAQDAANGKLSVDGTLYDAAGAAAAVATASIPTSAKGAANGVATLDNSTKIPIAQIPTIPYNQLSGAPTSFPPSGSAGGDLGSSYPTPTVVGINGQNLAALGAGLLAQSASGIPHLAQGSDITGLLGFTPVNAANIGVANGIAGLDANAKVPLTQIPTIPYTQLSGTPVIPPQYVLPAATGSTLGGVEVGSGLNVNGAGLLSANFGTAQGTVMEGNDARVTGAVQSSLLGQPGGVATLNSSGLVPNSELGPAQSVTNAAVLAALGFTPLSSTTVGAAGGIASLDNNGKVPIGQIPTIPYANLSGTPTLGTIASHSTTDFVANNSSAVEAALGFTPINSGTIGQASGIAGLDANGLLLTNELPAIPYSALTGAPSGLPPIGAASGDLGGTYPAPKVVAINGTNLAGLGAGILQQNSSGVPSIVNAGSLINALGFTPVNANTVGAAGGLATLDSGGKVPLGQVPSLPYSIISNPPTIPAQYVLPAGTSSVLGGFTVSTGLSATSGGALSVNYGTGAGTSAQGNDSRIVNAIQTSAEGAAGGVATLDGSTHIPISQIPSSAVVTNSTVLAALGYTPVNPNVIGVAGGIASLDGSTKVPIAQIPTIPSTDISGLPTFGDIVTHNASEFVAANQTAIISALGYTPVNNASVGVANGIATLGANGLIPLGEIPTSGIVNNANVLAAIGYQPVNPNIIGVPGGLATLDGGNHIPVVQLPTGIPATDLDTGEVSNTEFSYLDGVTSSIQTQFGQITNIRGNAFAAGVPTTSGETYVWNATNHDFEIGPIVGDAISIRGNPVKAGTPTQTGQAYVWNATNNDFEIGAATTNIVAGPGIIAVSGQGSATISTDSAVVETVAMTQHVAPNFCSSTSGSATAYRCDPTPPLNTLAMQTGPVMLFWRPDVSGTGGATTINVSSLGAVPLKEADGVTDPTSTDIGAGRLYPIWYDGTNFRMIAFGSGGTSPGGGGTGGTYMMDSAPPAYAAYSLRRLYASYTGAAVYVVRASDQHGTDIGFTSTGDLNTGVLTSFCTANSASDTCTVANWYDQSGNGRNAVDNQYYTYQPVIFNAGSLVTQNGKPALMWATQTDYLTATLAPPYSSSNAEALSVGELAAIAPPNSLIAQLCGGDCSAAYNTSGQSVLLSGVASSANLNSLTLNHGPQSAMNQGVLFWADSQITPTASSLTVNTGTAVTNSQSNAAFNASYLKLGMYTSGSGTAPIEYQSEFILFQSTLSQSNQSVLGLNQRSYWNTGTTTGGGGSTSYMLDSGNPSAAAAYSLRRLSTSYSGKAIYIVRASDTTGEDIGFTSSGDLDTSAIMSFCSGTTCTVANWYDQSGNGRNAVNNEAAANQPIIVNAGSLVTKNGKPALMWDTNTDYLTGTFSSPFTSSVAESLIVADVESGAPASMDIAQICDSGCSSAYNTSGQAVLLGTDSGKTNLQSLVQSVGPSSALTQGSLFWADSQISASLSSLTVDSAATVNATQTNPAFNASYLKIGMYTTGTGTTGIEYQSEFIVFPSVLTSGQQSADHANQKAYWGTN